MRGMPAHVVTRTPVLSIPPGQFRPRFGKQPNAQPLYLSHYQCAFLCLQALVFVHAKLQQQQAIPLACMRSSLDCCKKVTANIKHDCAQFVRINVEIWWRISSKTPCRAVNVYISDTEGSSGN